MKTDCANIHTEMIPVGIMTTAFRELPPATLPDLAGFLILQMDVLSETAEKLHKKADADMWKQRADRMLEQMLGELVCRRTSGSIYRIGETSC